MAVARGGVSASGGNRNVLLRALARTRSSALLAACGGPSPVPPCWCHAPFRHSADADMLTVPLHARGTARMRRRRRLQAQLAGTSLAQSFVDRAPQPAPGHAAPAGASAAAGDDAMQPLDLDMNLVKNLLRSYTAQGGLAGPAGNLAGLLGIALPEGDVE